MIQRVKNVLAISCDDVDFSTSTNIEFYIKQDNLFKSYIPTVVSSHSCTVTIPKADMLEFGEGNVSLQLATTDADGAYHISDVQYATIRELLKEAGYGS